MKVQYCLVLDRPIRLGLYIAKVIGPFDDINDIGKWSQENLVFDSPDGVIETILAPTSKRP